MANALYKTADVPRFDTYPAPPPPGMFLAQEGESQEIGNTRLNSAAETVGSAVGRAVVTLRDVPQRLGVPRGLRLVRAASETAALKAEELRSSAAENLEMVQRRASAIMDTTIQRATETVDATREQMDAALCAARERLNAASDAGRQWMQETTTDARRKAVDTVDRYPVHTLAAICAAGLVIGSGLRLWRSHASRS